MGCCRTHPGIQDSIRVYRKQACNRSSGIASGGTVSKAIAPHDRYARSGEINFEVESVEDALAEVDAAFGKHESSRLDGVSHDLGDWWSNVRPSNTEPLLRLNVEAVDRATMDTAIAGFVEMFGEPVEH